ncbi:MAG: hypothetical protein NTZ05_16390 [Chloroflexi bacterium]|nr:hypothetical protein [Chloroflexota bacterium]
MKIAMRFVELDDSPDLAALAEEVQRTQQPCLLRRHGQDVAVLQPAPPSGKRLPVREFTEADDEAFLAAGGGWEGLIDTDKFIEDIYESRRRSIKPPVDL